MYEGFVNFNVGMLGVLMVEGCIFQGVVVGDGSDIGGGLLIMGMFLGGGMYCVLIGVCMLFGVNVGIGILFGDDCIVEVGFYVIVGIKIVFVDGLVIFDGGCKMVKGVEFFGQDGLFFCCNLLSGVVEVVWCVGVGVMLNEVLYV